MVYQSHYIVIFNIEWYYTAITTVTIISLLTHLMKGRCRWYYRQYHDDVIKWKHFPRYWLFVRGIHRSPMNSPHKGQWRGALMFSFIFVRTSSWVNNREAGGLRRHRAHYDVILMLPMALSWKKSSDLYYQHRQDSIGLSLNIRSDYYSNHIQYSPAMFPIL